MKELYFQFNNCCGLQTRLRSWLGARGRAGEGAGEGIKSTGGTRRCWKWGWAHDRNVICAAAGSQLSDTAKAPKANPCSAPPPALCGWRLHGPAARVQPGGASDHRVPIHRRAGHLPPRLPCHLLLLPDLQRQHPDLHREPVQDQLCSLSTQHHGEPTRTSPSLALVKRLMLLLPSQDLRFSSIPTVN